MPTVAAPPRPAETLASVSPEQRFLLDEVTWGEYEAMLRVVGDRPIRVTYDRGSLELMSPSVLHEEFGHLFGLAIQALAEELGFPCRGLKSATWRREIVGRGIEADECFYLANLDRVLGMRALDLDRDPPPDLAIEIEISRSILDRLGVYAALGIPEVWTFDGEAIRVRELQRDATYAERERSPALPFMPLEVLATFIREGEGGDHSAWGRRFRAWVRENLVPEHRAPDGAGAD